MLALPSLDEVSGGSADVVMAEQGILHYFVNIDSFIGECCKSGGQSQGVDCVAFVCVQFYVCKAQANAQFELESLRHCMNCVVWRPHMLQGRVFEANNWLQ